MWAPAHLDPADAERAGVAVFLGKPGADGEHLVAILVRRGRASVLADVASRRSCGILWYAGGRHSHRIYNVYGDPIWHARGGA